MNCPWCDASNREGAAFCRNCGRLLLSGCPRCGASAAADANFCDACGAPLGPRAWTGGAPAPALAMPRAAAARQAPAPTPDSGERAPDSLDVRLESFIPRQLLAKLKDARRSGAMAGERRIVTMLFCDLKGSTALAEGFDPEAWTEIINGAFERMVRPVYRYEGTVARLMGDGLLAFFGAPIAHEDDPRRAVLAGLEIVAEMADYCAGLPSQASGLDVRVGINTGLVVVGAVGSDLRLEYSALGDAINVAARMEQSAEPGTIQITDDTLRLIAGQFDVEPLGGITVKGKAQPISAYRVLRRRSAGEARRVQAAFQAPLVNRVAEWALLRRGFEGLSAGRGGIVFLSGDAGLGKTRLIDEALERLAAEIPGARVVVASAFSYETSLPYGLAVRLLRGILGLMPGDPPETIRARLDSVLDAADSEARRALYALLGAAGEDAGPEPTGEEFARRLVAGALAFWQRQASAGPIVLALDDLQWADASSVDLLAQLFPLTETEPILFFGALRRERRSHGWRLKEAAEGEYHHRFAEAALYPLTDSESRMLLEGLLGGVDLPELLQTLVLAKAEGNPLFVEEVVHNLIERGHLSRAGDDAPWEASGRPESIELPDSLQALLTARIDRLDEATRRTLQVASVLGRNFARSPLAALVDEPQHLDNHLLELQRMELIREVARLPEPEYAFHHTLTHEATYNTILLRQRRALHRRAAEVIEALPGDGLSAVAPVLAHHYLEGDAPDRALPYLIMAADSALKLNATAEAIAHYERALPIALGQKDASEQIAQLYTCRGRALELQSRFTEADASYQDLEQLARERDDRRLELAALIGQGKLRANVTPLFDAAAGRALMERALSLSRDLDERAAEVRILWNLLNIDRFDFNKSDRAVANGERALGIAREMGLAEETAYLLNDLGQLYGTLGQLELARRLLAEAQAYWRALDNLPMLADSLSGCAVWTAINGELPAALAYTEEGLAIATRIGNRWGQAFARGTRGLTLGYLGHLGDGIASLRQAIEEARDSGFLGGQLLARAFLATLLQELGRSDEAVELARAGLEIGRAHLPQFAAMCLGRLAMGLLAQGKREEAAAVLADPLANLERQLMYAEYDVYTARLEYALAAGDPAHALALAEATNDHWAERGARVWLPGVGLYWARALAALGRPAEARDRLRDTVALARSLGARGGLWRGLALLAEIEDALGDREAGRVARDEAREELRFVLDNLWPDELVTSLRGQPAVMSLLSGS